MTWENQRLGDFMFSRRTKGEDGLPTLSVTLDRGLVPRDSLERKTDTNLEAGEHLRVLPGDIAYNMMRMWQGASGLAEQEAIVSPAYVVLAPKPNLAPHFASYLFKTPRMIHSFWAYSYGLTNDRLRLYPKDALKVPVAIPPLPEQKKIAEILSTWDEAIETTEALLAIARTQKRALMQTLLTGKRRFPEFEGQEWREVRLGDIARTWSGGTPSRKRPEFFGGAIPWIKSGEVNAARVLSTEETITEAALAASAARMVSPGNILVAMYGATAGVVSISGIPAAINQAILAVEPSAGTDGAYLHRSIEFAMDKTKRLTQGGQPNLNAAIIRSTKLFLPELEEQRLIAGVIDDAQREIDALRNQTEKLRTEKKALMQQLLTRKRRVQVDA
ncbi:restriction endonuclease subunit S [Salipiger abyssi]|nr:restriction endonuclease subunit S [Salipiger abyssi]